MHVKSRKKITKVRVNAVAHRDCFAFITAERVKGTLQLQWSDPILHSSNWSQIVFLSSIEIFHCEIQMLSSLQKLKCQNKKAKNQNYKIQKPNCWRIKCQNQNAKAKMQKAKNRIAYNQNAKDQSAKIQNFKSKNAKNEVVSLPMLHKHHVCSKICTNWVVHGCEVTRFHNDLTQFSSRFKQLFLHVYVKLLSN